MKQLLVSIALFLPLVTLAQEEAAPQAGSGLSYSYVELRFVDADNDGDGLRFGASYELNDEWFLLGEITSLDYSGSVDRFTLELGAGYVYELEQEFDVFATFTLIDTEIDTPFGDADDSGFGVSAGARGSLAPEFEVRGSVNHVNLDDSDTFLELAGDYYFNDQLSAGASLEFAGDEDLFTLGARYHFR